MLVRVAAVVLAVLPCPLLLVQEGHRASRAAWLTLVYACCPGLITDTLLSTPINREAQFVG